MAFSIAKILEQRKTEFENFLLKVLPSNKLEWVNQLQTKSIEEFILFFQHFVIGRDVELIVNLILDKVKAKKETLKQNDLHRFRKYLKFFSEFINNI